MMDFNKKWTGSSLVLDPEQVNQSRKAKQSKFKDKTKLIKRSSYVGIGLIIVTLSIALPLTLIKPTESADSATPETTTETVLAEIPNGDNIAVSFNTNEISTGTENPNDIKKSTIFNAQKKITNKMAVDVYHALLSNEMKTSLELGNFETLKTYVGDLIIEKEEKAATDADQTYLSTLLLKGYGSTAASIATDAQRLIKAKTEYRNSTDFLLQVYQTMLPMLYIAIDESRTKSAASNSTWREVWYLELPYVGAQKETASAAIKANLSTWNTYAADSKINIDEVYANEKQSYGLAKDKMNGYVGFVQQSSVPSTFTDSMKSRVFRSVSGDKKFVPGLQTSIDYEGNIRDYFSIQSDDETKVALINAQLIDEEKYLRSKTTTFDIDYLTSLVHTIALSSSSYLTSARSYYFAKERYQTLFTDTEVEAALKATLNPNNIVKTNPTSN